MPHRELLIESKRKPHRSRIRFWSYWISSVLATLVFLLFMATMLMVPGVLPSAQLWMVSVAGVALAKSVGIGVWKPGRTEAPIMEWPLGPAMGVILLLELAECVLSVFHLSWMMLR
jgi:hypothetical protein